MFRQIFMSFAALVAGIPAYAFASPVSSLHNFAGSPDGARPIGALVVDSAGNLYGTTTAGGNSSANIATADRTNTVGPPPPPPGDGTVFELSPPAAGSSTWTETILYTFQGGVSGEYPVASSLAIDAKGNLYGTTEGGGNARYNGGMVFELIKPKKGSAIWTEKRLAEFNANPTLTSPNGPYGAVVFGPDGALYGTASAGGAHQQGVLYRLVLPHTLSVIYDFGAYSNDGATPYGSVVFDKAGNLYATTYAGGNTGNGAVVECRPHTSAGANWTELCCTASTPIFDGGAPRMGLTIDPNGNLYGTTQQWVTMPQRGKVWSMRSAHRPPAPRIGPKPSSTSSRRLRKAARLGSAPSPLTRAATYTAPPRSAAPTSGLE